MRSAFSVFLLLTLALVSTSFAADNAIRVDGEFWIGLDRTEPVAVTDEGVAEAVARAVVVAPEKSRAAVDAVLAAPNDEPLMIGAHVDIPAADLSRWVRAGDRWLLAVRSEGAFFLRPHFAEFPPEYSGRVLVRAPHDESAEAIVGHGTHDTWGPAVEGDTFVVEVRGESSVPSLVVDRVSHGFRAVEAPPTKEQNCHLDPNCYSEYVDQRAAVALIQFEVFLGSALCTGSLIVNGAEGAWFYTANHCIGNQNAAASMIAYWEFETDVCNGAVPALASVPRTNGSDYVAGGSFYDYTLLKLHQDPPTGAFALGWTAEPLDPGENVAIIHHPSGAYKRLAFGFENGSSSQYWIIKYGEGNTEGGSSGSPLLNDEKLLVGTLTGGTSYCWTRNGVDWFGRFDQAYAQSLNQHLTTVPTTTTTTTSTTPADDDDDAADDDFHPPDGDDDTGAGDDDDVPGNSGDDDDDDGDSGMCGC